MAQAPYFGSDEDQRPMTVDVEEGGLDPEFELSLLKTVARATTHATWNKNPQRYLRNIK